MKPVYFHDLGNIKGNFIQEESPSSRIIKITDTYPSWLTVPFMEVSGNFEVEIIIKEHKNEGVCLEYMIGLIDMNEKQFNNYPSNMKGIAIASNSSTIYCYEKTNVLWEDQIQNKRGFGVGDKVIIYGNTLLNEIGYKINGNDLGLIKTKEQLKNKINYI